MFLYLISPARKGGDLLANPGMWLMDMVSQAGIFQVAAPAFILVIGGR